MSDHVVGSEDKVEAKFPTKQTAPIQQAASTQKAAPIEQATPPPGPPTPSAILNLEAQLRQIAHIDKYITLLIQRTQVNVSLTSTLVSLAVFSDDDVDKLDGISTDNAKAQKFYKMIKTKDNFYPHLITALEAGNQSGAVAILKALPNA